MPCNTPTFASGECFVFFFIILGFSVLIDIVLKVLSICFVWVYSCLVVGRDAVFCRCISDDVNTRSDKVPAFLKT